MGVITLADIDYGHIFGPFPSHVTPADPAYLIGMLTNDKRPDTLMLKTDPGERQEGKMDPGERRGGGEERYRLVDWLPYIQPARDSEEQNMEAYVKEGQVYFRALRIIRAHEELLVWYSKDFAQLLHIPELPRTQHLEEGEHYICPRCGDTFQFPYSLRAHIKFKCSYTLGQISPGRVSLPPGRNSPPGDKASSDRTYSVKPADHPDPAHLNSSAGTPESPKDLHKEPDFSKAKNGLDYSKATNGLDFRKPALYFSHPSNGLDFSKPHENGSTPVGGGEGLNLAKRQTGGLDFSKPFPRYSVSGSNQTLSSIGVKRSSGEGPPLRLSSSPKMSRVVEPKPELLSPGRAEDHSRLLARLDRSPHKTPPERSLKDGHSDVASAFRKVERSSTPETERSSSGSSSRAEGRSSASPVGSGSLGGSVPTSLPLPGRPPISSMARLSSGPSGSAPGLPGMPGSLMGLYMPRLPMVPPPLGLPGGLPPAPPMHLVSAHHPAFAAADQIPPGLLEMCRATIPSIGPLTESFANIRNSDGPGLPPTAFPGKPGMFLGGGDRGDVGSVGVGAVPFLKFNNPMVEKILQSTSPTLMSSPISALNMSQNWCAKCNATFRMTSDLVYHMRSHHKREFDPMKRKREEKLKCTICNETFRERHHLTRHMSSHA
ncbi:hypothetical protein ACOMHN_042790 [Nucella lapillus]